MEYTGDSTIIDGLALPSLAVYTNILIFDA